MRWRSKRWPYPLMNVSSITSARLCAGIDGTIARKYRFTQIATSDHGSAVVLVTVSMLPCSTSGSILDDEHAAAAIVSSTPAQTAPHRKARATTVYHNVVSQIATRTLRIATYNVHRCRGLDGRTRPDRTAAVLRAIGADIVALQEVIGAGPRGGSHIEELGAA